MVKFYKYVEPADPEKDDWSSIEVIVSEDEIREDYWPWWSAKMLVLGREPDFEKCIQDFCTVHFAELVE